MLYSHIIHIQLYMETVNNIDKRTHFFREIYLSHFILERVDVSCVWEVSWRWEQTATYWPQVPLYYSSTSSSFYWAAQPGSWGPKASVWCWLSLQHLVTVTATRTELCLPRTPTELKPFVAPGYIIVTPTCFLWTSAPNSTISTGQGDTPISSTRCTCYLHRCIS